MKRNRNKDNKKRRKSKPKIFKKYQLHPVCDMGRSDCYIYKNFPYSYS